MRRSNVLFLVIVLLMVTKLSGVINDELIQKSQTDSLASAQHDSTKITKLIWQSNTSLILSFMQGVGIGKLYIKPKSATEMYIMASGGLGLFKGLDVGAAVYLQNNQFFNNKPIGKFIKLELGIMANWNRLHQISISKSDASTEPQFSPLFSVGIGHSYRIGNAAYLRLSGDVGYKSSPVNLNLSFVF